MAESDSDQRSKPANSFPDDNASALVAVLDTVGAIVVVLDREGRIVRLNRAGQQLAGYSNAEAAGRRVWDFLLIPEDVERVRAIFKELRSGQFPNSAENYWVTKDGRRRLISWSNTALLDAGGAVQYVIGTGIDVTEHKQAEEALRTSEQNLARAQQVAHLGSHEWNISTGEIKWSDEMYRILGFEPGEVIPSRELYMRLLHPDDRGLLEQTAERLLKGEIRSYDIECRVVRPDGGVVTLQGRGEIFVDQAGRPVRVVGTTQDLTDRKRVEEALRLTQYSIDHTADATIWLLPDARLFYVNDATCRMLGYSREQLLSMTAHDINTGRPPELWPAHWSELRQHGALNFEASLRTSEGKLIPVDITANLVEFDGKEYDCSVVRDITARKQAENALRESEERYRGFVENFQGIAFQGRMDFIPVFFHGAVEEITGYREEEFLAGTPRWDQIIHPDDLPAIHEKLEKMITVPGYSLDSEYRIVRKDGELRWVRELVRNVCDDSGRPSFVQGAIYDITEQKRVEEEFEERQVFQEAVLECIADGIVACDRKGTLAYFNRATREFHGLPSEPIPPAEWASHYDLYEADGKTPLARERIPLVRAFKGEGVSNQEMVIAPKGLPARTLIATGRMLVDSKGNPLGAVVSMNDITERKQAEEALRESQQDLARAQREAHLGNYYCNIATGAIEGSDEMYRIHGFEPGEFTPSLEAIRAILHPGDWPSVERILTGLLDGKIRSYDHEYRVIRPDGRVGHIRARGELLLDASGRPRRIAGSALDITEAKLLEQTLQHTAFHDALTGLPNRALFEERLEQARKRARRRADRQFAVLFLDLDHFKRINDSHGHRFGDRLLIEVAARLRGCVRDSDTVARFGGDEFAVLLADFDDSARVKEMAERICGVLREPYRIDRHEVVITASIGIAMPPPSDGSSKDILRNADIAMYRAKDAGRDRSASFDASMHVDILKRMNLEQDLRRAIDRQQLRLHYQEIRATSSGRLAGVEALLRWPHPELGMLEAGKFIALAGDTGLIVPIGYWVFEEACRQVVKWREQDGLTPSVSVNLSGRQLAQPELADRLAEILEATGASGDALKVEVTETAIMENITVAMRKLERLKSLGMGLAIDDFGTGYSSLSRLKNLPTDTIKIDRSFVEELRHDQPDSSLLAAMVELGRNLGLTTVAEGVETAGQLARLRELGCDYVQGNFLSPPLDTDSTTARLRAAKKEASASG